MKNLRKYLNLRYDVNEIVKRYYWTRSKLQSKKNIQLLKSLENKSFSSRPIFIIGPPRSGSTLLYQLLLHRFKFCYLQNRMELHKYSLAYFTQKNIDKNESYYSDFKSKLGKTNLPNGPHEGGYFWRQFYPRDVHDYIDKHTLREEQEFEILNTIKFLQQHFQLPFISKNMEMAVRLKSIQKLFPEAIYIIMKRDPRATASSLVKARIDNNGSQDIWWSIRPKEYNELLRLPYHEQIAFQVANIYKALYDDFDKNCPMIEVDYESMCSNPQVFLKSFQENLAEFNIHLIDNHTDVPEKFKFKSSFFFNETELKRVEEIFESQHLTTKLSFKVG